MEQLNMPGTSQGNVQLDSNGLTPEDHAILQEMDNRSAGKPPRENPPEKSPETPQGSTQSEQLGETKEIPWETRYKDLERKFQQTQDQLKKIQMGQQKQPENQSENSKGETQGKPKENPTVPPQNPMELLNKAAAESLGVENGKISKETYEALEKAGRSKNEVDAYVRGVKAEADVIKRDVLSIVEGGEQQYNTMIEWAKQSYSKEDAEEFDSAMRGNGTNVTRMKQQVELLVSRYNRANKGKSTGHVSGSNGSGDNITGSLFRNSNDLRAAMQDKRYGKDAFYTNEVDSKAERSQMAGLI